MGDFDLIKDNFSAGPTDNDVGVDLGWFGGSCNTIGSSLLLEVKLKTFNMLRLLLCFVVADDNSFSAGWSNEIVNSPAVSITVVGVFGLYDGVVAMVGVPAVGEFVVVGVFLFASWPMIDFITPKTLKK